MLVTDVSACGRYNLGDFRQHLLRPYYLLYFHCPNRTELPVLSQTCIHYTAHSSSRSYDDSQYSFRVVPLGRNPSQAWVGFLGTTSDRRRWPELPSVTVSKQARADRHGTFFSRFWQRSQVQRCRGLTSPIQWVINCWMTC